MKTLLLFELHHLGDAVLSVPFIRSAKGCVVHVICRSGAAEVFSQVLPEKQIHVWEPWWEISGKQKLRSLIHLPQLLKSLRDLKADAAFCVWADSRVHWLMGRTGAARTFGFPVNKLNFYAHELDWRRRRMRLGQIVGLFSRLSDPVQRHAYQQAHLEDWRQLTEAGGWTWNSETPWFEIKTLSLLDDYRQSGKPLWLLHPGGRLLTKRWPTERFQHLLQTYFSGIPAILVEPPDSPALVSDNALHHSITSASFAELVSLVASVDRVLCNDSLVSHLAAALGKPVWTIFGSGNPNWFAPFENGARIIASDVCRYRPCIDRCRQPSTICLEAVSCEQVISALDKEKKSAF